MKKVLIAVAALSTISTLFISPAAKAAITLPAGSWPVCASASDAYCVESVVVTPDGGKARARLGLAAAGR